MIGLERGSRALLLILTTTALAVSGCAQPGDKLTEPIDIDAVLAQAVESGEVPGVVAVAATSEGPVYEGAFGMAEISGDVAMQVDSIFRIASMTKAVTSVAVMQLVEQGEVSLDRPASELLQELADVQVLEGFDKNGQPITRPPAGPITVSQLLTHTSGLVYELWNPDLLRYVEATGLPSLLVDSDEFLAAPLLFDPGERWEYGINTDWLGVLVERVSGSRLDAYFDEHIFGPLGMIDTHFHVPEDKQVRVVNVHARQADGTLVENPREPLTPQKFLSGGGGLVSTAPDYLRFVRMLLGGGELEGVRVLETVTVELMAKNHIGDLEAGAAETVNAALSNDFDFFPESVDRFGLGFLINSEAVPGGRRAGSLAWAGLFNSYFWIDPSSGVTGVLMTQILPFGDNKVLALLADFERAVYSNF